MQAYVRLSILLFILGSVLFLSCDSSLDGNLNENQPPKTFLTVDNIAIDEDNRLSSRVDISWWGDDPDGYIVGYEYAISDTSEGSWNFTTRTDSTFILPISPGEEVDDVLFAVRAIDNDGAVDPVGASVVFPLRNSPPITELNALELPPDTTYGVVSFGWNISDPDGRATILRTEIAVNDTANGWTEIPIESDDQQNFFITLLIDNENDENLSAEVFLGRAFRQSDIIIDGLQLNSNNTFYVRTVDRALAVSEVREKSWYLKEQTSNILVLNDDSSSDSETKLNFHVDELTKLGFNVDVISITDGTGLQGGEVPLSSAFPRVIQPTLNKQLAQWDHIYWFSNALSRNINFAQEILRDFFEEDGKLFVNIPVRRLSQNNALLNFIPIQQFVQIDPEQAEQGFQIRTGSNVLPLNGGPEMVYDGGIDNNRWPFEITGGAVELYRADFRKTFFGPTSSVSHDGISTIAVMNPESNFIYFGLDLATINAEGNVDLLLQELLINRLGFQQN